MPKDRSIEALGESRLLLPGLVVGALGANDRVKYLLKLMQTACAAADGAVGVTSLRDERWRAAWTTRSSISSCSRAFVKSGRSVSHPGRGGACEPVAVLSG